MTTTKTKTMKLADVLAAIEAADSAERRFEILLAYTNAATTERAGNFRQGLVHSAGWEVRGQSLVRR